MALAEHHPEQVSAKNRGVLKMSHSQLHDFAATKEKGKPKHVRAPKAPMLASMPSGGNRYNRLRHGGR